MEIVARPGHPAVVEYKVIVTAGSYKHGCVVNAGSTPLSCWVGGLTPATMYSVSAEACLAESAGCGPANVVEGATLPNRKFLFLRTVQGIRFGRKHIVELHFHFSTEGHFL